MVQLKEYFQDISSISYEVSYILGVLGQLTHAKHKNLNRIQKILANIKHISAALRMDITFYSVEAVNISRY